MLCWPLDSKDSTRWHHDIFMTSWHSPDWFLRKKNRGWWLVTCIFPWYDPYHPWSSGVFSASTCLKRCDWLKRPEQSQEAVQCSSSLSDVMLPLPWRNSVCFFWAGPQSQWSMQNRLFGCEHSNWPRCKSLGFPKTAFFTQFSVRLLATQSVSKFSCQVLIQNKLYIAMYIHTWLYIYIYFIIHILYYIHIKPAMFHPKWQKIPRHGGSFAAFFPAQDAMFSTEDSRAAADVTTWARPKPGRGEIFAGGLDEPVEFIGMSPRKEFECVIFVGTCVGRFGGTQRTT